jgi:hypothetical protein
MIDSEMGRCPFCGGSDLVDQNLGFGLWKYVHCQSCGIDGPANSDWNTRPIEDALRARLEKAEAALKEMSDSMISYEPDHIVDFMRSIELRLRRYFEEVNNANQ